MSQELLPCPVCGSVAELNETEDHTFVALCSDIFCTGNFGSSQPTKAEAIAAWNVQARLWNNRSCPNCNWSEADEQGSYPKEKAVKENMIQELLPCPFCGEPGEFKYDHSKAEDGTELAFPYIECFRCSSRTDTCFDEILASMAWNARYFPCCSNCGWSEEDEQGFLEHLEHLPKPSRWKKFLHRFFWTHLPYLTFLYATNHLWVEANLAFDLTFVTYVLFLSFEFLLHSAQSYLDKRRLDQYFNNNQTTTPTQPKENNHE